MLQKTVPYVPRPMPTLGDGTAVFLQQELASISQSIKTLIAEFTRLEALLAAHGIS